MWCNSRIYLSVIKILWNHIRRVSVTGREALKILQDGWIQVVQLKTDDEESTKENIKAQEAYAYIVELLKQKDETILDKIRAEIEQAADKQFQIAMGVADLNERCTHIRMENAYRHSLNIIDKYKAEAESEG
jgi:hypothetical protein